MKYKVIGWTEYENEEIEAMDYRISASEAVIDDIREHGYLFSGMHHQDCSRCAPVLNNGKKLLFGQRGFGGIMAKAHGKDSRMSYAEYAFTWHFTKDEKDSPYVLPEDERVFEGKVDKSLVEENLSECYEYEATRELFDKAISQGKIDFIYDPVYRFMDIGDTIVLKCEGQEATFEISDLDRYKIFTEDEQVIFVMGSPLDPEAEKEADKLYAEKPETIIMELKQIK